MAAKRSAAYYRVSTEGQAGERNVSLEVQREQYLTYINRRGYRDVGEYQDVASGRRDDRTNYQRMLDDCRAGKIDVVVTFLLDRFGRNTEEILFQTIALKRIGVEIECTNEDVTHPLIYLIQSWRAGEESQRIARRVRPAILRVLGRGEHWGPDIFGWRKDPATHQLAIYEPEARILRDMARWLVDNNLSLRGIALRLNAQGSRGPRGANWSAPTVRKMLLRSRNRGELDWGAAGTPSNRDGSKAGIHIHVPPIWDRATDEAVRARMVLHGRLPAGRSQASPHLLSGLLRCGECGAPVIGSSTRRVVRFYRCSAGVAADRCTLTYLNAERLEQAVLARLADRDDAERAAQLAPEPRPSRDYAAEEAAAQRELAAVETELRETYRLYRAGAIASEHQLAAINRDLLGRQEAAEQRLAAVRREAAEERQRTSRLSAFPLRVSSYLADMERLDVQARKGRLQEIVERVVAWRDGRFTISYRL